MTSEGDASGELSMYNVSRQWLLLEDALSLWLAMILFWTPDRKRDKASAAVPHST